MIRRPADPIFVECRARRHARDARERSGLNCQCGWDGVAAIEPRSLFAFQWVITEQSMQNSWMKFKSVTPSVTLNIY